MRQRKGQTTLGTSLRTLSKGKKRIQYEQKDDRLMLFCSLGTGFCLLSECK